MDGRKNGVTIFGYPGTVISNKDSKDCSQTTFCDSLLYNVIIRRLLVLHV